MGQLPEQSQGWTAGGLELLVAPRPMVVSRSCVGLGAVGSTLPLLCSWAPELNRRVARDLRDSSEVEFGNPGAPHDRSCGRQLSPGVYPAVSIPRRFRVAAEVDPARRSPSPTSVAQVPGRASCPGRTPRRSSPPAGTRSTCCVTFSAGWPSPPPSTPTSTPRSSRSATGGAATRWPC